MFLNTYYVRSFYRLHFFQKTKNNFIFFFIFFLLILMLRLVLFFFNISESKWKRLILSRLFLSAFYEIQPTISPSSKKYNLFSFSHFFRYRLLFNLVIMLWYCFEFFVYVVYVIESSDMKFLFWVCNWIFRDGIAFLFWIYLFAFDWVCYSISFVTLTLVIGDVSCVRHVSHRSMWLYWIISFFQIIIGVNV